MTEFYRKYVDHKFRQASLTTIDRANVIIKDMAQQGYVLTLRQLYYQFVSRNWIENSKKEYDRLGRMVTKGREAGLMDWYGIEDRRRTSYGVFDGQEDTAAALDDIEQAVYFNPWEYMDYYIEVMVEKEALEGVIEKPCNKYRVPYMACVGYASTSIFWQAGRRFKKAIKAGKIPVLIHLGDHDPSGLDMTEDVHRRTNRFAEHFEGVEVKRIALNIEQVEQYHLPPNFAKLTDTRTKKYISKFGEESWELDALTPAVIDNLIESEILKYIDTERWNQVLERERAARKPLIELRERWPEVLTFISGGSE